MNVCIGTESGEHIVIRVLSGGDPDDYGWLNCEIIVSAGAFSGKFPACLRTPDFPALRKQLQCLYNKLDETAAFTTMERQLELKLVGDGKGHIEISGTAIDQAGIGNRLQFNFQIDQTFLPRIIADIENVEREFPAGIFT